MLPDKFRIPTHDLQLRRWVEWHGYFPTHGTPQFLTMGRQLYSGFPGGTEPECSPASRRLIEVVH
jgi:hypothetical protein